MYLINTNLKEVTNEFSFIDSWIETICKDILHKDKDDCKIDIFYNYGYFVKKGQISMDQYEMNFDDRLEHELSKVRVNVTIKIDNLMLSNRLKKGMIPSIVNSIVTEITKYKMTVEYEFHGNDQLKNSIPPFDDSIISIEIIKNEIDTDSIENEYFNIDDILDKINSNGIESLTQKEKDFLDKRSREM